MTSRARTPVVPIGDLPGTLPPDTLPLDLDLDAIKENTMKLLTEPGRKSFVEDVLWRDFVALTGSIRTLFSNDIVFNAWTTSSARLQMHALETDECVVQRLAPATAWVDVNFTFETRGSLPAKCAGTASLIQTEGYWRIWMLRTWLEKFKSYHHPDHLEPLDNQGNLANEIDHKHDVSVVVVGGGQNGLSISGRLQALNVSYICLERSSEIGATWLARYERMRWNTPKEFNNLPFGRTFSSEDPEWLKAEHIATAYKAYVDKFRINVWLASKIVIITWDGDQHKWCLNIDRDGASTRVTCQHLVLAIGQGQSVPVVPEWPNRSLYKGDVLHALQSYRSASPWTGKKGIVIGTANTGMDIAEDMLDANMDVTMVQRGKTLVIRSEWAAGAMKPLYNRDMPTELADRIGFTWPTKLIRELTNKHMHQLTQTDSARFDALEHAGFKVDRPGDLISNLNERFGGYYFDFGACAKIEDGHIKVKSDSPVQEFTRSGLRFEDGNELEADIIIFATGFEADHREQVAGIVGRDIADRLDDYWGLDAEGELRGAYKPCGQENLWLMGGDTRQARWFSRFVALQIQAAVLGHHPK